MPVCGAARARPSPTTTSTSGESGRAAFAPSSTRAAACPIRRPVGQRAHAQRPEPRSSTARRSCTPSNPCPTCAVASTGSASGDGAEATFRRRLDALGYPVDDVAVSRLVDPVDWSRAGHRRRHAVLDLAPVPPVRTVPAVQRRAAGPGPAVRGMRHRPRRRRARWCCCRAGWPPTAPTQVMAR